MSGTDNNTLVRRIAAVTLALWLVGQFVCLQHCASANTGHPTAASEKACCHKNANGGDHSKSGRSQTTPSVGCLSLKMLLSNPDAAVSIPSDQFNLLAVVLFVQPSNPTPKVSSIDRQAWRPDSMITHEVSLGSAAHTLAPPFLS